MSCLLSRANVIPALARQIRSSFVSAQAVVQLQAPVCHLLSADQRQDERQKAVDAS